MDKTSQPDTVKAANERVSHPAAATAESYLPMPWVGA
jgi:hypothetical protein